MKGLRTVEVGAADDVLDGAEGPLEAGIAQALLGARAERIAELEPDVPGGSVEGAHTLERVEIAAGGRAHEFAADRVRPRNTDARAARQVERPDEIELRHGLILHGAQRDVGRIEVAPRCRQIDPAASEEIRELLRGQPLRRDLLIEFLHLIQDKWGHISAARLAALAEVMRLPQAEVYEVATFYHHFDVVKEAQAAPPEVTIRVCDSLSCALAGSGYRVIGFDIDPAKAQTLARVLPAMAALIRQPTLK